MRATKKTLAILFIAALQVALFAGTIRFSGGYTKVSLADGKRTVSLTENAQVTTEDFVLSSDSIKLYGTDYSFVDCVGKIKVVQEKRKITLTATKLFYNRTKNEIVTDGWTEIEDLKNEAKITAARLEYNIDKELMKLEIEAKIEKNTSRGLMSCKADTITFDNKAQLLTLKGEAGVEWDGDVYSAAIITVNLETEEITMTGSVNGEMNG